MSASRWCSDLLDDLLREGLKLVVCGTAAGDRSARLGQYYAGPGNKFWRTLASLGLTPRLLTPGEAGLLADLGIGLTDLVKGQSGPDSRIEFRRENRALLRRKIEEFQPGILCFNGKRAAREYLGAAAVEYGLQPERIGATRLFVAPSTSAAANGSWDPDWWRVLAELVRSPASPAVEPTGMRAPAITIRVAVPEDAAAIAAIHAAAVNGERGRGDYDDRQIAAWAHPRPLPEIRERIGARRFYVAETAAEPAGYAQLDAGAGVIRSIYVVPGQARRGVGRRLADTMLAAARDAGLAQVELDSSLNAVPFYEALGFTRLGNVEHGLRDGVILPCVRMAKRLADEPDATAPAVGGRRVGGAT